MRMDSFIVFVNLMQLLVCGEVHSCFCLRDSYHPGGLVLWHLIHQLATPFYLDVTIATHESPTRPRHAINLSLFLIGTVERVDNFIFLCIAFCIIIY